MNPIELRNIIAKAIGWKEIEVPLEDDLGPIGDKKEIKWLRPDWLYPLTMSVWLNPPHYETNLNVTIQAVRHLINTPALRREFMVQLCTIADERFGNSDISPSDVLDPNEMAQMFLIDCDASDYCQAIVKTLKL